MCTTIVHMLPKRKLDLHRIAETQDGFFTAKQSAELGFDPRNFHHFVKSGEWLREGRGLYRLAAFPSSPHQDLWRALMWSRNKFDRPQGVFSYHSALDLYGLSDLMANEVHMTVPRDFRRNAPIPTILRLHLQDLPSSDIKLVQGLPCTTPLKTLADLIEFGIPDDLIRQGLNEGLERGLITRSELQDSKTATGERLKELARA